MPSLLDMPAEIIELILLGIREETPERLVKSRLRVEEAPCVCFDDGDPNKRLPEFKGGYRWSTAAFALADPYIMGCITQAGYFGSISVKATREGLPIEKGSPCDALVRNINLSFDQWNFAGENAFTGSGQSFQSYLQQFPSARRLDIDLDECLDPLSALKYLTRGTDEVARSDSEAVAVERILAEPASNITSLTVQLSTLGNGSDLPPGSRSAPALISGLTHILHLPNLEQLHVTFRYDLNYYDEYEEDENQRWFAQFASLKAAAEKWPSLQLVKVCVRIGFDKDTQYLSTLDLWREALSRTFLSLRNSSSCKIQVCLVYDGMSFFELSEFAQTRDHMWTWAEHLAPVDEEEIVDFLENIGAAHNMRIPEFDLFIRDARYEETPETLVTITHLPPPLVDTEAVGARGEVASCYDLQKIGAMQRERWIEERERSNGRDYRGYRNDPRDPVLDDAYFAAYPRMRDVLA